jgi:hypothetical protein
MLREVQPPLREVGPQREVQTVGCMDSGSGSLRVSSRSMLFEAHTSTLWNRYAKPGPSVCFTSQVFGHSFQSLALGRFDLLFSVQLLRSLLLFPMAPVSLVLLPMAPVSLVLLPMAPVSLVLLPMAPVSLALRPMAPVSLALLPMAPVSLLFSVQRLRSLLLSVQLPQSLLFSVQRY